MSATLEQTLCSAAIYTFERMVFLLPDIPPDEIQRRQNVEAVATISFSGPARGRLQVHAGQGLLPRLTANMMGMDVAPEALQLDALGEIANVICGQVLPALHPVSAFEYMPPRVVTGTGSDDEQVPSARIELGLESSRAELLLFLEPEPAGTS
ncbi:MAG TPA: chemotaxis protein CheX [Longimicrobiales bacterium]|nr:chemotaxis protein CheX [Longimicrobiales bacterium]